MLTLELNLTFPLPLWSLRFSTRGIPDMALIHVDAVGPITSRMELTSNFPPPPGQAQPRLTFQFLPDIYRRGACYVMLVRWCCTGQIIHEMPRGNGVAHIHHCIILSRSRGEREEHWAVNNSNQDSEEYRGEKMKIWRDQRRERCNWSALNTADKSMWKCLPSLSLRACSPERLVCVCVCVDIFITY